MQLILVTDRPAEWQAIARNANIMSAIDYLHDCKLATNELVRIINLCQSYQYQSTGYYVSLLAQARGHKVLPTVMNIQDIKNLAINPMLFQPITEDIDKHLCNLKSNEFELSVYFGKNIAKRYTKLAHKFHALFPLPLFRIYFKRKKTWQIKKITPLCIRNIPEQHLDFLKDSLDSFLTKKRFYFHREKAYNYQMAILCNPQERNPPSDHIALENFIKAADNIGINAELICKDDFKSLGQYDALFIRETTAVNHHTYRFARAAASERVIVIDDPVSILKCTNKVYLAELLKQNHVPTPDSIIISKQTLEQIKPSIKFPCVLKKPDSSFSQGVVKADNAEEFELHVKDFFKTSDLIICQSYMPSEYDWRIGILNNQPLFACRYYMAKNHWQIYNWEATDENAGGWDTLALDQVPKNIIQTALKACRLIGDSLYGVDLKVIDDKAYVIEINDNPNIDSEVEDAILGERLYQVIIEDIAARIKRLHGYVD